MSLYCDRTMNDAISSGKISENTELRLVFPLDMLPAEMTLFMFLAYHRDTQAIFFFVYIYIYMQPHETSDLFAI